MNHRRFVMAAIIGLAVISFPLIGLANDVTHQRSTQPVGTILVERLSPSATQPEQQAYYQGKIERLRNHHLVLPTAQSFAPFSARRSENRQIIRPRREARLVDGIFVGDRRPATEMAKLSYGYVSPVAEPSVAIVNQKVLITFNWGAVWSDDGGQSFSRLDPISVFGSPAPEIGAGFCCDQIAKYVPHADLMIWLLQGAQNTAGNTVRLLVARGADLENEMKWTAYDFSPSATGDWQDEWFDYPDIAYTDQFLFVSLNSFSGKTFNRSAILRISLKQLAALGKIDLDVFSADTGEDFAPKFAHGGAGRMFWATHKDDSRLIVHSWGDDQPAPDVKRLLRVERWATPTEASVATSVVGRDKRPWLNRLDERVTAGWTAKGTVGFAWSSGAIEQSPDVAGYRFPHIRVAIVQESELSKRSNVEVKPISEPHIFSNSYAMAYPAAATNAEGEVGFVLFFGGPLHFPSSAVGVLQDIQNEGWKLSLTVFATGANTPRCVWEGGVVDRRCGAWGDFATIRAHPQIKNGWYVVAHTALESQDINEKPKVVVTYAPFTLKQ